MIINKILKLILLKFTFANSKIASNNGKANPRSNLGPNLSILVKYAEIRVNSKNRKLLNIKNIKKLLAEGIKRDDGINRPLQYIITTHSSHIVTDSDFDDIN